MGTHGTPTTFRTFFSNEGDVSEIAAIDRLRLFLRPPGRGLSPKGNGAPYAARLLETIYGTSQGVTSAWEDSLQRLRRVNAILVGIPTDAASRMPGAQMGPVGVREAFLKHFFRYPKTLVDVGDVISVPPLLHDDMLSETQKASVRRELYPGRSEALPVSPLSITDAVIAALLELNAEARLFVVGGDHSVTWPVVVQLHRKYGDDLGVLHLDARPDLNDSRFGVKYCASTWAFHAMQLLKPHTLVQVGIRNASRPKDYWTAEFPIAQFWAQEASQNEAETIVKIAQHFRNRGVSRLYVTHDIDATETLEPETGRQTGLSASFVLSLVRHLQQEFSVVGGDVVQVAPFFSSSDEIFSGDKNCLFAAQFLKTLFENLA